MDFDKLFGADEGAMQELLDSLPAAKIPEVKALMMEVEVAIIPIINGRKLVGRGIDTGAELDAIGKELGISKWQMRSLLATTTSMALAEKLCGLLQMAQVAAMPDEMQQI